MITVGQALAGARLDQAFLVSLASELSKKSISVHKEVIDY
jgi:hypothetical protein